LDTFGAQVSSDHERYPADVKCLGFLYLYVGRYPRNNASRNNYLSLLLLNNVLISISFYIITNLGNYHSVALTTQGSG
ncbi:MAG: hypothetical protein BECKG1743F_GA0114225_102591, partial [Candidatus Kentron sp. G]